MNARMIVGVCGAILAATWTAAVVTAALPRATSRGQVGPFAGGPLEGVSPAEFEEFRLGLEDFLEVETADEGLGPAFNGTSCAVCHNVPVVGGGGIIAELRAATRTADGQFAPLHPSGETLFQLF